MPDTAEIGRPDFLVIGAGIAGVCLAGSLRARGASVAVVEATQVCGGSSALNAGGVRQQFSQAINVELARRTVERLVALQESRDVDLSHRQVGYLFMVSDAEAVPGLQAAIELQNSLGVPSRWLSVDDVVDAVPGVRAEGLVGATFCPTDGYLDPNTLVTALAADARSDGVRLRSRTAVVGVDHAESRVTGVRLQSGTTVQAGTVVNCAGAWAAELAQLYGATLPIQPWRSQCYQIAGVRGVPPDCPVTIDFDNGKTYFHPEYTTFLAGTDADDACVTSWDVPFDDSKADVLVRRLTSRHRSFDDATVVGGWAGMLELTADENPICDWTHFDNVYTMAGFSGHGLPIAPSLAEEAAAVLTGDEPTLDLFPYRFDRFDGSTPLEAAEVMAMR